MPSLSAQILPVLDSEPGLELAILFGSLARGDASFESDLDIAVSLGTPIPPARRQQLADRLAVAVGRPVDLVDLSTVGGALLGQILRHGTFLRQTDPGILGRLYERYLDWKTDLQPAVEAMLESRRRKFLAADHG